MILGGNKARQVELNLAMANRHGLIAGATGTGKTVTLQVMAEAFSRNGIPVFLSDAKGDLSGLAASGKPHKKIDERLETIGIQGYRQRNYPTVFWDIFGNQGHPVRTTLSEFGPLLLASFLDLSDAQTGLMYTVFKLADDEGMLLLDLKDLKALLNWLGDQREQLESEYGRISTASVAAIQRKLMTLELQGADKFFGEPALQLSDMIKTDFGGNGVINILDATRLIHEPRLYGIFLLWLISELFEQLPEVGDAAKPKFVFFFDEAHLLFDGAPKVLLDKIEQVVRLIRSKGVGIYFVSQSPADIPEDILGQLGNRVQHALRAFTPKDQKAVRVAAQTFRPNPEFSTEDVITTLGVGEALVSTLDSTGSPGIVEKALIAPPESRIGALSSEERAEVMQRSPYHGRYDTEVDRESAYEILKKRTEQMAVSKAEEVDNRNKIENASGKSKGGRQRQSGLEAFTKSTLRSIGSSLGRQIARGILGSITGKR